MFKSTWAKSLPDFFLFALALSIPFPFIYGAICIVLLTLSWLLTADFKTTVLNLKSRKMLWPWIIYFLLHAISYSYSDNKAQSTFDLQTKLSILLLPLVIGAGLSLTQKTVERVCFSFTIGISVVAVICIAQAVMLWRETGSTETFFYHKLIGNLEANAVYEAWYTFFSIALILLFPWRSFFTRKWKFVKWLLLLLQLTFFLLLSARMLIALFFIVLVPVYIIMLLRKKRIHFARKLGVVIVAFLVMAAIATTENPIKKRYKEIAQKDWKSTLFTNYYNVNESEFNNFSLRIFLWRLGLENVTEKNLWLTGAGNGDAQKLQNDKIIEHKIIGWDPAQPAAMINANLHNMVMQSLLMIGLPGAITFLFILFSPLFTLNRVFASRVFFLFHISAIIFMMQESALQTQAGVVYFSFFSAIFWNTFYRRENAAISSKST